MLPIYVGNLGDVTIDLDSPPSLTDQMSAEEQDALEGWAASLGGTSPTSADDHTTSQQTTQSKTENTENSKRDDKHTSSTDSGPGAIRTTYLLISMMTQRTGSISIWIRQRSDQ